MAERFSEAELRRMRDLQQENLDLLKDQSQTLMQTIRQYGRQSGESTASLNINTRESIKLAQDLSKITSKDLADKNATAKLVEKINKSEEERRKILKKVDDLLLKASLRKAEGTKEALREAAILEDIAKKQKASADFIGDTTRKAKELTATLKEVDKEVKIFDDISEIVGEIPVLRKLFKELGDASKIAREKGSGAGFLSLLSGVGKAGLVFSVSKIAQGLKAGDDRATSLARNLNISKDAGLSLQNSLQSIAASQTGIITKEIADATITFSTYMGSAATFSRDNAITFVALNKQLGLSADIANKLTEYSAGTGREVSNYTKEIIGSTLAQNVSNRLAIRYQDILSDIANASAATRLSLEKYPGALEKATYQARALGLTFSQLEASANSLLNFEQSISAELNAELLTGKELSLDRARIAAELNDSVTLAKELAKNIGTSADFSRLSRTQQEGFSQALGMSREEISKTLIRREALVRLGAKESEDIAEVYKNRLKEINLIKDKEQRQKALANLNIAIGNRELQQQLKTQSIAEAQSEAMTKIADAASVFADALQPAVKFFQSIGSSAASTLLSVIAISSVFRMMTGRGILQGMGSLFASTTGAAARAASAGSGINLGGLLGTTVTARSGAMYGINSPQGRMILTRGGTRSLALGRTLNFAKSGLGAGLGLGMAGMGISALSQNMEEGTGKDLTSMLGSAASYAGTGAMIGSIFPGVGTALGAGIGALVGAGVSALSIMKANEEKEAEKYKREQANGQVVEKLDQLIQVYKQGGAIYMDSNKVGNSLSIYMPKTS